MKTVNSPYLNINRLEFIVTYQCNGRCRHCQIGRDINRPGIRRLDPETAAAAVKSLCGLFPLTSVMTFGGEPLFYPDTVCAVHKAAADCGIPSRQVITNGYFTNNPARSREVAEALKEAGVNDLMLSADGFHQPVIPLEPVERFARDLAAVSLPVSLHPAWLVDESHDNPYNADTRRILERLSATGFAVSSGNRVHPLGNARRYLAEYFPDIGMDWDTPCGSLPYTDILTEITSLTVDPGGDVLVCGFAIGNLHRQSMGEIAAGYDPYSNGAMRAILSGGARGLLEYAGSRGMPVDTAACYTICDLCRQVAALERQR